jgi:hypothetical protein
MARRRRSWSPSMRAKSCPGHVTLQTLPFSRTARRVLEAAGGGEGERGGGGLGGVIGNVLGG